MAEAKPQPYSDSQIEIICSILLPMPTIDYRRFLATITARDKTIEQLKKDAELKDSLAEGVMTLAEVHEQLEDAKATVGRLRGALGKIYKNEIGTVKFKYRDMEMQLACPDCQKVAMIVGQALDAGKE